MGRVRDSARVLRRAFALVTLVTALGGLVSSVASFAPLPPQTRAAMFRAMLVDQGPAPTLLPGTVATYTMRFRNVVLALWQRGAEGRVVRLGVVGDAAQ